MKRLKRSINCGCCIQLSVVALTEQLFLENSPRAIAPKATTGIAEALDAGSKVADAGQAGEGGLRIQINDAELPALTMLEVFKWRARVLGGWHPKDSITRSTSGLALASGSAARFWV